MKETKKYDNWMKFLTVSVIVIIVCVFTLTISNTRLAKGTYGAATIEGCNLESTFINGNYAEVKLGNDDDNSICCSSFNYSPMQASYCSTPINYDSNDHYHYYLKSPLSCVSGYSPIGIYCLKCDSGYYWDSSAYSSSTGANSGSCVSETQTQTETGMCYCYKCRAGGVWSIEKLNDGKTADECTLDNFCKGYEVASFNKQADKPNSCNATDYPVTSTVSTNCGCYCQGQKGECVTVMGRGATQAEAENACQASANNYVSNGYSRYGTGNECAGYSTPTITFRDADNKRNLSVCTTAVDGKISGSCSALDDCCDQWISGSETLTSEQIYAKVFASDTTYKCKAGTSHGCYDYSGDPTPSSSTKPSTKPSTGSKTTQAPDVPVNPPTGMAGIIVAWLVGLSAIVYSLWYFKKSSSIK